MAQYRALVGIDYPPNKRVEAGDLVSDLPGDAIKWLLTDGLIEDANKPSKKTVIEEAKEVTPAYVPDAKDGDNDGKIQDGTVWERSAGTEMPETVIEEIIEDIKGGK
jgi:hypothetical protein